MIRLQIGFIPRIITMNIPIAALMYGARYPLLKVHVKSSAKSYKTRFRHLRLVQILYTGENLVPPTLLQMMRRDITRRRAVFEIVMMQLTNASPCMK